MPMISSIAGLLSLCGISTVRMFAPIFLFGALCRFLPGYDWCPPGVSEIAGSCPPFMTGDFGLCVFGVLGVLEVLANWDDTIRELISESNVETYVKPIFTFLVTFSLCSPEQAQVISTVVNGLPETLSATNAPAVAAGVPATEAASSGVSFGAICPALLSTGISFCLCKVRAGIVAAVRELDPDNTLHLNTVLTLFEEGSWLAILPILLVFPCLALVLMAVLAVLGWVLSRPLAAWARKRRAYWDAIGQAGMLKMVRDRAIVVFACGVFLSALPVVGYLVTVIALNLFVFGVIALYERRASRLVARLVMRFFKLTVFLVSILFSGVPFMGILLLVPYAVSYVMRTNGLKRTLAPEAESPA